MKIRYGYKILHEGVVLSRYTYLDGKPATKDTLFLQCGDEANEFEDTIALYEDTLQGRQVDDGIQRYISDYFADV